MRFRLPTRRADAAAVFLIGSACGGFINSLMFTPLAVYYVLTVGMDPLQLILVGTTLEATIILFEVPTGIVADVFSRRLSIVLGRLLVGVAFIFEGSIPLFGAIVLAEMIRAIGETFLSGASQAWLADEVGNERVAGLFLRGAQLNRAASLAGIAAGVGLASIQLNLAVIVGGSMTVALGVFLALAMPETGFRRAPRTSHAPFGSMVHIVRTSVRHMRANPVLLLFLGIAASAGASSEGFDRLWEAHLLTSFTFPSLGSLQPIVWFGILNTIGTLLGIAAIQLGVRRLTTSDDQRVARVLLVLQSVWLVAVVVFGLTENFAVAVLALWSKRVADSMSGPLFAAWRTRVIPSEVRATVLSAISQGDAIGQVLGGPMVGAIGSGFSIRAAMVASSALHAPVLALLVRLRGVSRPAYSEPENLVVEPGSGGAADAAGTLGKG
ncbi:MAG TPA: MFS transporter [Chloroflexota bacterium]